MRVKRVTFRHQSVQPCLQVAPGGRIGVLLDRQAGGGVADEHAAETFGDASTSDDCANLMSDLVQTGTRSQNVKMLDHAVLLVNERRFIVPAGHCCCERAARHGVRACKTESSRSLTPSRAGATFA